MRFRVEYSPEAFEQLQELLATERKLVVDAVDRQLTHDPHITTRNRKLLRPNLVAPRELRIGDLRVFYDVDQSDYLVKIRAIGIKRHNVLKIGGEEVEL